MTDCNRVPVEGLGTNYQQRKESEMSHPYMNKEDMACKEQSHAEALDHAAAELISVVERMQDFIRGLNGNRNLTKIVSGSAPTPVIAPGLVACLERTPGNILTSCRELRQMISDAEQQLKI